MGKQAPLGLRLARLGLLKPGALDRLEAAPGEWSGAALLPRMCDAGLLLHGLSLAPDLQPDEVMGSLAALVGGTASELRVLDVRNKPGYEFKVSYRGEEERWDVPDVPALVHNLNDLLRSDGAARAIAVLGEWNDALHLWCVPKELLPRLFREDFFEPLNGGELRRLFEPGE